jgi:hypothetical protein
MRQYRQLPATAWLKKRLRVFASIWRDLVYCSCQGDWGES